MAQHYVDQKMCLEKERKKHVLSSFNLHIIKLWVGWGEKTKSEFKPI